MRFGSLRITYSGSPVFINGQRPSHTLLPALTEAAPKDLLVQICMDFGQVAKSIIDHLGTIHGLIDFVAVCLNDQCQEKNKQINKQILL